MFHARDQNMHGQVPVFVSRFVPWGRKSLWLLNLLCVALQGRGAAPSALSGHKHFINHSHSQAALTVVLLRERLQQPKTTGVFLV